LSGCLVAIETAHPAATKQTNVTKNATRLKLAEMLFKARIAPPKNKDDTGLEEGQKVSLRDVASKMFFFRIPSSLPSKNRGGIRAEIPEWTTLPKEANDDAEGLAEGIRGLTYPP